MRTIDWVREERIHHLRDRIWKYLSPSVREEDQLLQAAALLQMPSDSVAMYAQLHFLLSDEVGSLLDRMPRLLRRLTTSTTAEEELSHDRIAGPIHWPKTIATRLAGGSTTTFVTTPARRAYQTPENEVLAASLDSISEVGTSIGWDRADGASAAATVTDRIRRADRFRQHRVIEQIQRRPPTARAIARVRSGKRRRDYSDAVAVFKLHESFVRRLDRDAIRTAIEQRALVVADDPTLFELQCLFDVLDALGAGGWDVQPLDLFSSRIHTEARRDGIDLEIWYQRTPAGLGQGSAYRRVQSRHGIGSSDLIPDLVFKLSEGERSRWVIGEAKLGEVRTVQASARAALKDLLAYRRAFDQAVHPDEDVPYGIGMAWGEGLEPQPEEIVLTTPDNIAAALELALGMGPG